MNELINKLKATLFHNVTLVENDLRQSSQSRFPQAIIRSGSWANPRIIAAYTSVFPTGDNSEDSIDSMIQLTLSETSVEYRADIAKSNGEIIAEVWDEIIEYESGEEILAKVDNLNKKVSELLSSKLRAIFGTINMSNNLGL
jgi:hypothetical protein